MQCFGVPGGSLLACYWMPKATLKGIEPKLWKRSSKLYQMCRPRVLFEVTFGVRGAGWATSGPVWASLLEIVVVVLMIFLKKCGFVNSTPLLNGMPIFACPGVQVGATWSQKSRRRATLVTFGRLGDGRVRGAVSELWELLGNGRDPTQTQVQAEVKVYLSDKTYD